MEEFEKILGYKSIKNELEMTSDILKNYQKYEQLGVKIPSGLILYGEPGVGKTLMANCFIEASGWYSYTCRKYKADGDFLNEIKNTYNKAMQNSPSIVLLDDMDKFANEDSDHKNADEYVTIQSCIDNAKDAKVFTIATANSLRNLPDSLLRAGRLDKNIEVLCPIGDDAEKIISYYLSQKKCIKDIDTKQISKIMNGKSCADLEAVVNEAGIYTGYESRPEITTNDLIRACMKILFDAPESLTENQKRNIKQIAYHEAGHAVIAEILEPNSVNIVSVRKHESDIGGVTSLNMDENYFHNIKFMKNRVISLFGGKAATELVFNDIDIGASSDIRRAMSIIERFVTDYCELGISYNCMLSKTSARMRNNVETAITSEANKYYKKARQILFDNREFLDKLANALIDKQTLLQNDIKEIKDSIKID